MFLQWAKHIPEINQVIAAILRAVGRSTLVLDIAGAREARIIQKLFIAYHRACANTEPTLLEFGLTHESQESMRNLFAEHLSIGLHHKTIYLLAITGHLAGATPVH